MVTLTPCQSVLTLHRRKENVVRTGSVGFVRSVYSKRRKMQNGVVEAIQKQSSSKPDCPVHFINFANYASVRAMEVDVSEEITCKRQNQSQFLSLSH